MQTPVLAWVAKQEYKGKAMANAVPAQIHGQKYLSLITIRKNGTAVYTPVWFAENGDTIYVMTRNDSGKYKRIRNNPEIRVAPCTIRGKVTGPEFPGHARILLPEAWVLPRQAIRAKYLLARLSLFASKKNEYMEITF